jgi:flagellin-like protein
VAKRKGISPVIATVIIVAVTIAVAIAVAFWMTGIIGLFTGFEQLQITSIYDDTDGIYLTVKNTGTSTATITDIFINGYPSKQCGATWTVESSSGSSSGSSSTITLKPGEEKTIKITVTGDDKFTVKPGVSLEIKLHTASGKDYPKLIVLQAYGGTDTSGTGTGGTGS